MRQSSARATSSKQRHRPYHVAAGLLVIGVILWFAYYLSEVSSTLTQNYELTQCNQGLLLLSLHGVEIESKLKMCPTDVRLAVEAKYK